MSISNMLKGIGGDFEINRVVGAAGALGYIVTGCGITWLHYLKTGAWDLQTFCLVFPAGLGVAVASIAGAVALKDRNVAQAQVTQAGVQPGTQP